MPEFTRAIIGRIREFVGNRRRATRYSVRVPVTLSQMNKPTGASSVHQNRPATLDGHTLDISATGAALVMPAIRIGENYLTDQARQLEISFELAAGQTLLAQAIAVRYEPLDGDENKKGYVIGVRFIEVNDQQCFDDYLLMLGRGGRK